MKLKWILPIVILLASSILVSPRDFIIDCNPSLLESNLNAGIALPAEGYSGLVLEWMSEDNVGFRPLEGGTATGYKVTIQASMPTEGLSFSTIAVNPYTYQYGYVSAPPTGFDPLTDAFTPYDSRFEWYTFDYIPTGTTVTLVAKADSDINPSFLAWSGDIPATDFTYANNILANDMMTSDRYEVAHLEWTSQDDTLYVVGFCDEGMYEEEVKLDIYMNTVYSASSAFGNVQRSLYYFGENRTFDLLFHGYIGATEATRELVATEFVPDITVNQFWSPHVTIDSIEKISATDFNISWSSTDASPNDENWYEVAVSLYGSYFFAPIAENLTETYFLWDSSEYTPRTYSLRVRAYSVDLSYRMGPFVNIPEDYFPGDCGEAITESFHAGEAIGYVLLSAPDDISIQQGPALQSISWSLNFADMDDRTERIAYDVFDNGQLYFSSFVISNEDDHIEVDLYGFNSGYHNLTLILYNPDGTRTKDMVNIYVTAEGEGTHLSIPNLLLLGVEGVCGGIMILFSFLSVKEYRKRKAMGA